jgi:hypothetical protein
MQCVRRVLLLIVFVTEPALFAYQAPAFLNLTAVTATSINVEWPPVPGAVRYIIRRNGAADVAIDANAGFLQGGRYGYTDIGRRPATLHTYNVEAQFPAPAPPTRSPTAQVVTPQAFAPLGFHALLSGVGAVTLSWQPCVEANSYRIIRSGGSLPQVTLNPTEILYVDQNLPAGQYTYTVYSVIKLASGEEFDGEYSNPVTITARPFNIIAIGDSVMWGQGLLPAHKFATGIQTWIQGALGIPVTLSWYAHSGAITYPNPNPPTDENLSYDGEVPSDSPTISHQLELASAAGSNSAASDVDLILMDGCANNIEIKTVLNPFGDDGKLILDTEAYCGAGMTNLLRDAVVKFPHAGIVVTGYFPFVSGKSDLAALIPVFAILGVVVPPDPTTVGIVTMLAFKARAVARSSDFFQISNTSLLSAVTTVNATTLPPRTSSPIRFASLNPAPENSYAAPNTWQWLIPTPPFVQDEVYNSRTQQCDAILTSPNRTPSQVEGNPLCRQASMGHPNVPGALAYVNAIQVAYNGDLAVWQSTHLGPVTATEDYAHVTVQLGPVDASGGAMTVTAATVNGTPLTGTLQLPAAQPAPLGSQAHYSYAANNPTDILATIEIPNQPLRALEIPARKLSVTTSVTRRGNNRVTVVTAADAITGAPLSGTVTIGQVSGQTGASLTYPPCKSGLPGGRIVNVPAGSCVGRLHVDFYPDVSFEDVSLTKTMMPKPQP